MPVEPRLFAAVAIPILVIAVLVQLVTGNIGAAVMMLVFLLAAAVFMWAAWRYSRTRR